MAEQVLNLTPLRDVLNDTLMGIESANDVRTVMIFPPYVYVETFTRGVVRKRFKLDPTSTIAPNNARMVLQPLSKTSGRRYFNVEEVLIDASLAPYVDLDRYMKRLAGASRNQNDDGPGVPMDNPDKGKPVGRTSPEEESIGYGNFTGTKGNVRLRQVALVDLVGTSGMAPTQVEIPESTVTTMLMPLMEQSRKEYRDKGDPYSPTYASCIQDNGGFVEVIKEVMPETSRGYLHKFSLNIDYKTDARDGDLRNYLVKVAEDDTKLQGGSADSDSDGEGENNGASEPASKFPEGPLTGGEELAIAEKVNESLTSVKGDRKKILIACLMHNHTPGEYFDGQIKVSKREITIKGKTVRATYSESMQDGRGVFCLDSQMKVKMITKLLEDSGLDTPDSTDVSTAEGAKSFYTEVIEAATRKKGEDSDDLKRRLEVAKNITSNTVNAAIGFLQNDYKVVFKAGFDLYKPYAVLANAGQLYKAHGTGIRLETEDTYLTDGISDQDWMCMYNVYNNFSEDLEITSPLKFDRSGGSTVNAEQAFTATTYSIIVSALKECKILPEGASAAEVKDLFKYLNAETYTMTSSGGSNSSSDSPSTGAQSFKFDINNLGQYENEVLSQKHDYFPWLMSKFAYGSSLPGTGAPAGYSQYEKEVISAYLKTVFTYLIEVAMRNKAKSGESQEINRFREDAQDLGLKLVDAAKNNLRKVILVSNYKTTETTIAELSIKLLGLKDTETSEEAMTRVDNKLEQTLNNCLASLGSQTLDNSDKAVVREKGAYSYRNVRFVGDAKVANGTPLFAYKALEAQLRGGGSNKFDLNNMIIGMDVNGNIVRAGAGGDLNFENTTHYILAGTRAGKGVMTLNLLANTLSSNTALMYVDNKPDMLSMLRAIEPNMFGINGADLHEYNPREGTNLFDNCGYFNNVVNPSHIPDFVDSYITNPGKTWKSLGTLFYLRAMMFISTILALRCGVSSLTPQLGGDGLTIVYDEFKNTKESYDDLIELWYSQLAPNKGSRELLRKYKEFVNTDPSDEKEREKKKKAMNTVANEAKPGMYWARLFIEKLMSTVKSQERYAKAGGATEGKSSNIFLLGQTPIGNVPRSKDIQPLSFAQGFGSRISGGCNLHDLIVGLTNFNGFDAFLGRNDPDYNVLGQCDDTNNAKTQKARQYLNDATRGFAYVSDFSTVLDRYFTDSTHKPNVSDIADVSGRQLYFKPLLLMETCDTTGKLSYPMRNCEKVVSSAYAAATSDMGKVEEQMRQFRIDNAQDPENCDPSHFEGFQYNEQISFLGYSKHLVMASNPGMTEEQAVEYVRARLRSGADAANFVALNILGYPAKDPKNAWLELITDLRPQWLFSSDDIVEVAESALKKNKDAFLNNTPENPAPGIYRDRIHKLCEAESVEYSNEVDKSMEFNPYVVMYTVYQDVFKDDLDFVDSGIPHDPGERRSGTSGFDPFDEDDTPTTEFPEVGPDDGTQPTVPIPYDPAIPLNPTPEGPTPEEEALRRELENINPDDPASFTPAQQDALVTSDVIRLLRESQNKELLANGNTLTIDGTPYANGKLVPNPSRHLNFAPLFAANCLRVFVTSKAYFEDRVPEACRRTGMAFGPHSAFLACPTLETLQVDSKVYNRSTLGLGVNDGSVEANRNRASQQGYDISGSGYDTDSYNRQIQSPTLLHSIARWVRSCGNDQPPERRSGAQDLVNASWNKGRQSYRNGGVVRKGAAAALGIAGAGLVTGGASTALLLSLASFPPAWGAAAVVAAVRMLKKK